MCSEDEYVCSALLFLLHFFKYWHITYMRTDCISIVLELEIYIWSD